MNPNLKKAQLLNRQALFHRRKADQLQQELTDLLTKETEKALQKKNDRLINRREALDLLWFDHYSTLREWEQRVRPLGYLNFTDENKILRSEVLRFLDDYQCGTVHQKLRRRKSA